MEEENLTSREKLNDIAKNIREGLIQKYGTSEGAMRAWDTRGRGRNTPAEKEKAELHGAAIAAGKEAVKVAKIKEAITKNPKIKEILNRVVANQQESKLAIQQLRKVEGKIAKLEENTSKLYEDVLDEVWKVAPDVGGLSVDWVAELAGIKIED